MSAYYNEIDPFCVEWLGNLAQGGHIAPGPVDGRSIRDLDVERLSVRTQMHFFAGIGAWSYALRLAGWPDDAPVWTGSCPCQPFSQAGRRKGTADERHLWPEWFRLIRACGPPVVFGEQVANPDGLAWLDSVLADLEGAGYEVGAADLCAAGIGAPHLRQRLYFVAVARGERREGLRLQLQSGRPRPAGAQAPRRGAARTLADDLGSGCGQGRPVEARRRSTVEPDRHGDARELGDARSARGGRDARAVPRTQAQGDPSGVGARRVAHVAVAPGANGVVGNARGAGPSLRSRAAVGQRPLRIGGPAASEAGVVRGFWSDADLVYCRPSAPGRDGEYRPVEPGSEPLAHGAPARVGRVRAYGNAIVSEVAATFIRAVMDCLAHEAW